MPQLDPELLNSSFSLALISVIMSPFSPFVEGSSDFEIDFDFFLTDMLAFLLLSNIKILKNFITYQYLQLFNFFYYYYLTISTFSFLKNFKNTIVEYLFLTLFFSCDCEEYNYNLYLNTAHCEYSKEYFISTILEYFTFKIFSAPKLSLYQTWEFSHYISGYSQELYNV
jgi:hypothetical protein